MINNKVKSGLAVRWHIAGGEIRRLFSVDLRMENPIGLLRGDTFLSECGIRNESKIIWENS